MTTTSIPVPQELVINVADNGGTVSLRLQDLPEHILAKYLAIGVQRHYNSVAPSKQYPKAEDKRKAMLETYEQHKLGDWGRTRTVGGDPLQNEIKRMAIKKVQEDDGFVAWVKANKLKSNDAAYSAALAQLIPQASQDADLVAEAKRRIEGAAAVAPKLDLSKLVLTSAS